MAPKKIRRCGALSGSEGEESAEVDIGSLGNAADGNRIWEGYDC